MVVSDHLSNETAGMQSVRIQPAIAYVVSYVAMVALGRMAILEGTGLALFWPAAGVAALWMLRGNTRQEVAFDGALLLAAGFAINVLLGIDPRAAVTFALANLVQGLVVRAINARIKRLPFTGPLDCGVRTPRDLLDLGVASLAAASVGSVLGGIGAHIVAGRWAWAIELGWVVRNGCSIFVVGAAVLSVMAVHARHRQGGERLRTVLAAEPRPHLGGELVLVAAVSVLAVGLVFGVSGQLPVSFMVIAVSAWVGFRFSPVVGALHSLAVGTVAVLFTQADTGVFGGITDLAQRAVVVQVFITIITVIALMLSLGVAERHSLHENLRRSEARATERADLLDAVTTVMTDGLVVLDQAGSVLLKNPTADTLGGTGHPWTRVTDPAAHGFYNIDGTHLGSDELPHALTLRGQETLPRDLLRIDPVSGRQTTISVSGMPLFPADGDGPPLAVMLMHDVTHERARRRELEAFAGVVAHDLRNPLTSVKSWAELLAEQLGELETDTGVDTREVASSLEHVLAAAERMHLLIDDLLTYTRTQSVELRPQVVQLDDLVADICSSLGTNRGAPPPRFTHDSLGEVHADPTLVRQVFTNLLGNAVKYVEPGTRSQVEISTRPCGSMVEVRVSDNGIGIPDAERDLVFDSFYRARQPRAYPGTGLGLAISADAVQRHGGRISARPGPDGTGTTMVFTLPAVPGESPSQDEGRTTSAEPPPRRLGSETAVS